MNSPCQLRGTNVIQRPYHFTNGVGSSMASSHQKVDRPTSGRRNSVGHVSGLVPRSGWYAPCGRPCQALPHTGARWSALRRKSRRRVYARMRAIKMSSFRISISPVLLPPCIFGGPVYGRTLGRKTCLPRHEYLIVERLCRTGLVLPARRKAKARRRLWTSLETPLPNLALVTCTFERRRMPRHSSV